jgi:hypothetical protein
MKAHATKPMNINGTILTDEMLAHLNDFEQDDMAKHYCDNLDFLKDFLIKLLGDNHTEADTKKLIEVLTDVTYLHDFMKLFVIEEEEAA